MLISILYLINCQIPVPLEEQQENSQVAQTKFEHVEGEIVQEEELGKDEK